MLVNASALTGFLYLLVHPILGRTLAPVDYAGFVQLMGLLAVLGVPAGAVRVAISRYVSEYAHGSQVQRWVTVVRRALHRAAWVGLLALLAWSLASGWLADLLHAPSRTALLLLGVMGFISLFTPIMQGTLQGAQWFGWFALASLTGGVMRLLLAGGAGLLDGGVGMVLVAVTLSLLCALLISWWPFRRLMRDTPVLPDFDTRPIYRYIWPVLAGQGAVFLLVNADIIFSARFLKGDELAAYGKVATLSRTVMFLSQPVALAMFPRAVTSPRLRVLMGPLAFAFLISLAGAVLLYLAPSLPMRLMYRVSDPYYDQLTRLYVWAALPHAMVMFTAQYLWARHQTRGVLMLIPVLALYLVALWHRHDTPETMIGILTMAGWISLALIAIAVAAGRRPARETPAT